MKSLQLAMGRASNAATTRLRLLGVLILGLITSSAFASEGEGVHLKFGSQDNLILIIAAILGLVGIATAAVIGKGVATHSRGGPGMQEVQDAIEEGARSYLNKQISMMLPFIFILASWIFLEFSNYEITAD